MIRQKLAALVTQALEQGRAAGIFSSETFPTVILDTPANEAHGDFACNIALQLAKPERKAPRQVAEALLQQLQDAEGLISRTEIAGPGFINFFIAPAAWQNGLRQIAQAGPSFGSTTAYRSRTRCCHR